MRSTAAIIIRSRLKTRLLNSGRAQTGPLCYANTVM
jgi:hypothetical protein